MAKKAAAKTTEKAASASEVDEVLETKKTKKAAAKDEDVLEGKASKKAAKKAPPAKKAAKKAAKSEGTNADAIREFLRKCRKLTSYADVAEATGADLRQVRRTARGLRDDGEIEIVKEGTVCFVKKA